MLANLSFSKWFGVIKEKIDEKLDSFITGIHFVMKVSICLRTMLTPTAAVPVHYWQLLTSDLQSGNKLMQVCLGNDTSSSIRSRSTKDLLIFQLGKNGQSLLQGSHWCQNFSLYICCFHEILTCSKQISVQSTWENRTSKFPTCKSSCGINIWNLFLSQSLSSAIYVASSECISSCHSWRWFKKRKTELILYLK